MDGAARNPFVGLWPRSTDGRQVEYGEDGTRYRGCKETIHRWRNEKAKIRAAVRKSCACCGTSASLETFAACKSCWAVRYCSWTCQKRHEEQHKPHCQFMVHCTDIAGEYTKVGPLSPASSVAQIREMAASWKEVDTYRIQLVVHTTKITDHTSLVSAGISREQGVTVVVMPALDFGQPPGKVPRSTYMNAFGLLDTEDVEQDLHAGMYLY